MQTAGPRDGAPDRRGVFAGPAASDHAARSAPRSAGGHRTRSVVRGLRDVSRSYDDLRDHSPRPWRRPRAFRAQQYPRSRSRPHRRTARHTPARPPGTTSARGGRGPPGCHGKHPPGPWNRDHGRREPAAQGGFVRARRNGFAWTGMRNGLLWPVASSTPHPRSDHSPAPTHQAGGELRRPLRSQRPPSEEYVGDIAGLRCERVLRKVGVAGFIRCVSP